MIYSHSLHDSVSPWMILSSVALHLIFFAAAIVLCGSMVKATKQQKPEETVTKVAIVDSAPGPNILEQPTLASAAKPVEITDQDMMVAEEAPKVTESAPQTIKAKAIEQPEAIKPIKRKRTPKKMESVQKAEEPKKPEKKSVKKPQNPAAELEQRIADLKKKREGKNPQAAQSDSPDMTDSGRGGRSGTSDDNLNRWILEVKSRIKNNWSILADTRDSAETQISVQIEDNGVLRNAAVDESSGDKSFDLSAMRAVMQAAPFPPMPMEVKERIKRAGGQVALKFTPKGLQ